MRAFPGLLLLAIGLLLACTVHGSGTVKIYDGLVNKEVARKLDLSHHIVEDVSDITISNEGSQPASSYLVAVPASLASKLSIVQAFKSRKPLAVSRVQLDSSSSLDSLFFRVELPQPIQPGSTTGITLQQVYTHMLLPYPAEITQEQAQLVQYAGNAAFFSPYKSTKQKLTVKLGTTHVESFTSGGSQRSDEIDYPAIKNVAPYTHKDLSVHYENMTPFATITKMVKEIEVSHWGAVSVEDRVELVHGGARLVGQFSRFDLQKNMHQKTAAFGRLVGRLPPSASDLYYRDGIGNVSTSHVRHSSRDTTFEIETRFPLFGGWKTEFYYGYTLPSPRFLSTSASDPSHYFLNVSFAAPFAEACVDELEVRVILPEGASAVQWHAPFEVDQADHDTRLTYLDTVGRPVLVLRKRNVVKQHNVNFMVGYQFSKLGLVREPLMVTAVFLIFFASAMLFVRADFSLSPRRSQPGQSPPSPSAPTSPRALALAQAAASLSAAFQRKQHALAADLLAQLNQTLAQIKQDASVSPLAADVEAAVEQLRAKGKAWAKASVAEMESARSQLEQASSALAAAVKRIA